MAKAAHLLGPYQEGKRFRICVYEGERRIKSIWCQSRAEAESIKARMAEAMCDERSRTVGETLDEYLIEQKKQGLAASSLRTFGYRLRGFLPSDLRLSELSQERAAKLYAAEIDRVGRGGKPVTAATHRAALKSARVFFQWIVERGYSTTNPFARIKPVGRVSTGKRQLHIDEARKLCELLINLGESGDEGATAVLTQLLLGMRSSEVLSRRVRDLDNDARELWIERGKTKHARRRLEIQSDALRSLLVRQQQGRQPDDLLFGFGRTQPHHSMYLWRRTRHYCALAGVPSVCPHSLRGLHSTLAVERGATSGLVAAALGHGSFAVTARHYIDPSTLLRTQARRVHAELTNTTPTPPINTQAITTFLKTLPEETLATILRSLTTRN